MIETTVDEDIYELGEQKRKLSDALLSKQHHKTDGAEGAEGEGEDVLEHATATAAGGTKGKKHGHSHKEQQQEGKEDWSMISSILSKALQRTTATAKNTKEQ